VTGAEFSEVDIDLLADYVGGALDGTPDEAVVAALITEDAAWRDAHALLSVGVAAVTGQLRAWGSVAEPMPADVFARLDAALLGAATSTEETPAGTAGQTASIEEVTSDAPADPAAMEPGSDGAAPARHLVAVPSRSRDKRARRLRWAAPVGIAAGVLAFVGFGFPHQFADGGSEDSASSVGSEANAPEVAPRAAAEPGFDALGGAARIVESGTDYRLDTLNRFTGSAQAATAPQDRFKAAPSPGKISADGDPLDRLRVSDALRGCIEAIAAQHGAGEIVAQSVDFARFDGAPAVVVEFTAADGAWVWASGPGCGTDGVGAATLGSVKVG